MAKLLGAVNTIGAVRLIPETLNCSMLGLADVVPWQAVMLPVAWLTIMPVVCAGLGFTVMVNWVGVPVQPDAEIKLPGVSGRSPALTVATTLLEAVLIIDTVLL